VCVGRFGEVCVLASCIARQGCCVRQQQDYLSHIVVCQKLPACPARKPAHKTYLLCVADTCMCAGEAGFNTLERRWYRPTLEIVGMWGGFTGRSAAANMSATSNGHANHVSHNSLPLHTSSWREFYSPPYSSCLCEWHSSCL
jgi:hypothetical protein